MRGRVRVAARVCTRVRTLHAVRLSTLHVRQKHASWLYSHNGTTTASDNPFQGKHEEAKKTISARTVESSRGQHSAETSGQIAYSTGVSPLEGSKSLPCT